MKHILVVMISTVLNINILFSQIGTTIGSDRKVDWTKAGIKCPVTTYEKYIDVTQVSFPFSPLVPDGGDDSPNFNTMLINRDTSIMTVYYFPQGVYHFYQQITLSNNVIIRGAGSDKTIFMFSNSENNIVVQNGVDGLVKHGVGESAVETYIIGGKNKGSTILTFDKDPNIKVGDLIDLKCQDDWPNWSGSGSEGENHYKIGQVSMVVEKQGNTVTIADELRLDFNYDYARSSAPGFILWAHKTVNPAYNVGIENIKIDNESDNQALGKNNISFTGAYNCWVSGVNSMYASVAHINVSSSTNIEIRGSYFHHAKNYGGGGHGYGVTIGGHSSNVLVEDNIFFHLRHAMILSNGANGNVFGYNFSYEQYSNQLHNDPSFWQYDNGDGSVHGNFPFANLFEGNILEFICADNHHSINGPFNTFFRNKVERESDWYSEIPFSLPNGGILIQSLPKIGVVPTPGVFIESEWIPQISNVVGNILKDVHDQVYYSSYPVTLSAGNGQIGLVSDYSGVDDISYYKTSRPDFITNEYTWPTIGCSYNNSMNPKSLPTQENPAFRRRYWNKKTLDAPAIHNVTFVNSAPEGKFIFNNEEFSGSLNLFVRNNAAIPVIPKTPIIFGAIQYVFSHWTGPSGQNTYGITAPGTYTAHYNLIPVSMTSPSPESFSTSSQRKIVAVPQPLNPSNLLLFATYENLGKIWIEYSYDGGVSWTLGNQGMAIDYGKSPSVVSLNNGLIVIVFAQNASGGERIILQAYQTFLQSEFGSSIVIKDPSTAPDGQAIPSHPVVGVGYTNAQETNGIIAVAWNDSFYDPEDWIVTENGIFCKLIPIINGVIEPNHQNAIQRYVGGGIYSKTPSIAVGYSPYNNSLNAHIAYSEANTSIQHRKYQVLPSNNYSVTALSQSNVSLGGGFTENYAPSIIAVYDGYLQSSESRISWIGKRYVDGGPEYLMKSSAEEEGYDEYKTLFRGTPANMGYNPFFVFGTSDVSSTSINKTSLGNTDYSYHIGWSEPYGNYFVKNSSLSVPQNITGLSGSSIQLSNGIYQIANPRAMAIQNVNGNYKLNVSASSLPKSEYGEIIKSAREGILYDTLAQFYYSIGDVTVNNIPIEFIEIPDSLRFLSLGTLNQYLESKPFLLTNSSVFIYGVRYGLTDSTAAIAALENGKFINYKVELVDNNTGEVIGVYDQVNYNSSNVFQYRNIGYQVQTNGIGERMVKLRLVIHTNTDFSMNASTRYAFGNSLYKRDRQLIRIGYDGKSVVTDYTLSQNFPNPFNPTTTISYALPQDGMVTLKIYDALGREISTLVNEFKQTGRYTASFDASKLSSGVYIYKLTSGKYTATKKMMLVK